MKHQTHIYLAVKSIEFLYESMNNLTYTSGAAAPTKLRTKSKYSAKELQRLMRHHQALIEEASWAPDDILNDKVAFHTFKLFCEQDFPNSKPLAAEVFQLKSGAPEYYRRSGAGGLAWKVDHLSRFLKDVLKLRNFNGAFSMHNVM